MSIKLPTGMAILHTLYKIEVKWRRTYSQVTRANIQKLLRNYYGIDICLSTVSYHLWKFHILGIIRVFPRYKRIAGGRWINLASNRSITGKGINLLRKTGVNVVMWLYNWAFKGIKPQRIKDISDHPHNPDVFQRPPRRSAAKPLPLGDVLKSTLDVLT